MERAADTARSSGGILRALRHRNYRLFFTAAMISNIGGWLAGVARGYLVYQLTGSKALLGTMAFVGTIPVLLLGPVAGIVADRCHRKPVILTTQSVLLMTNAILAALILTGCLEIWHMLALSLVEGIAVAFNSPVYQSLTVDFVGEEDLMNGIALNSLQFNVGRIIGSMLGGVVYDVVGPGWSFGINAASFVVVLVVISLLQIRGPLAKATDRSPYSSFLQGMRYLARHKDLLAIVALAATLTVFVLPYFTLLPVYAKDILKGGPRMQAYLLTAVGVGALLAGLRQAVRQDQVGRGRRMLISSVMLSVCLVVFSKSEIVPLSLAALMGIGVFMVSFMTTANTTIQLLVPDELRGRLISVFVMASFGLSPIGSLILGWAAQFVGAPNALLGGSLISVVFTLVVAAAYPGIRRV
jgi:MFS family permease